MSMPSIGQTIDRLTKKDWRQEEIDRIVGADARAAWLTHARDESIRAEAASGGGASALLIHGVENKLFDGAVVCRTVIVDGKVRAEFALATTREEILAARGSKYVETKFLRDVLPILRENPGRYAVCGLPCDISNLKRWEEKDPALSDKIALRIAFLCGHNSRTDLIDGVTAKLARETGKTDLVDYRFRMGHWRGQLHARYADGSTVEKPFSYFSDYRNLSFFSERKCIACFDHFGYDSDISIGDIWLYRLRKDSVKHSGVLARSERGQALVESALESGGLIGEAIPVSMILDGQSRIGPTHYNITARSKAGKALGIKIPDPLNTRASVIQKFSAYIGLLNMKISEGPHHPKIFRAPRPLVKAYLFFKKGLETLK